MKIIVSSKALASKLSEIDFDNDCVYNVVLNPTDVNLGVISSCELSINTNTKSVKIMVEAIIFKAAVRQENRRWEWIKQTLSAVSDQPVVLVISESCTSVIFQY